MDSRALPGLWVGIHTSFGAAYTYQIVGDRRTRHPKDSVSWSIKDFEISRFAHFFHFSSTDLLASF